MLSALRVAGVLALVIVGCNECFCILNLELSEQKSSCTCWMHGILMSVSLLFVSFPKSWISLQYVSDRILPFYIRWVKVCVIVLYPRIDLVQVQCSSA